MAGRFGDQRRHRSSGTGPDTLALDAEERELRLDQTQDDAGDSLVVDEDVAAGAEDAHGNALEKAAAHDGCQLVAGARLHEKLGRSAHLEEGEGSQRLAASRDVGEFLGKAGHANPPGGCKTGCGHHRPEARAGKGETGIILSPLPCTQGRGVGGEG